MTALVWSQGQSIVLAKSPPQSRRPIHVIAANWDHANECFVLSSRIIVQVAANGELLTGGSVLDSETGLSRSYLVLGKADSIYICGLDFEQGKPNLIAKLPLPNSSTSSTSEYPHSCIEGCWLVDGPSVVVVKEGQLLLVTSQDAYRATEFDEMDDEDLQTETVITPWEAHVLSLPERLQHQTLKIHFCGDVRSCENQEIILSLTAANGKRLRTGSASPDRYLHSWSFYRVSLNTKGPVVSERSSNGGAFKLKRSEQIPTELDPKLIACVHPVAMGPFTSGDDASQYLFVGTTDKRLLKCRDGQIVDFLHLESVPVKLQFGVVAEGQGVVLAALEGLQQNLLAVCPESLQILQDWSNVWRVVVDDFTSSGHDQIVLLSVGSSASEGFCTPSAQLNVNFTVVHGFSTVTVEGVQQGSQQHLAETKAINDSKMSGMETICKALQKRVQSGLAELQVTTSERNSKKELVRISSSLMQNLITRSVFEQNANPSLEGFSRSKSIYAQERLEFVRATKAWSRVCGTNWFLFVETERTAAERGDAGLHDFSLMLTSLNGSIKGKSSVLKSLTLGDGTASLVVCVPFHDSCLRPGLPLDVSVRASVSRLGDTLSAAEGSESSSLSSGDVYTQWLGGCEVVYPTVTPQLESREACTILELVGEQVQFVIVAKGDEHLSSLSGHILSTLQMQEVQDNEPEVKNKLRWLNLCSAGGYGPYGASLCHFGLHTVIKLRAIDSDLLLILEQTLVQLFTQHHILMILILRIVTVISSIRFEIVSRVIPSEALDKMDKSVSALRKHLAMEDSSIQRRRDERTKEARYVAQKLDAAVDERFSDLWALLG
ncbi:hypothetical protein R1sor_024257 [Riccia sorocarpa]|uniref:DNA damage-binding protein 1 n=1 Tax=Riccia sorocarpa TaxID=122646 RepID=A0ABD3GRU6_9MARC